MRLFSEHPRSWRENRYVYPVISRRSQGLSIGINLNPDKACNFDCIYCCVDRAAEPRTREVDLAVVRQELDVLLDLAASGRLFDQPPFDQTPPPLRRLNDIAFSGDGEPTAYPHLLDACLLVHERLAVRGLARAAKIILITNATLLDRPGVGAAIAFLHGHHGEVWAKLDAGTDAYYRRIDRSRVPLGRVLANITRLARRFPVVIQSLFLELDGAGPEAAEIEAYIGRLRGIHQAGGAIEAVQVYTIARGTAHPGVAALDDAALQAIARQIEAAGFAAHVFGAPVASAGG